MRGEKIIDSQTTETKLAYQGLAEYKAEDRDKKKVAAIHKELEERGILEYCKDEVLQHLDESIAAVHDLGVEIKGYCGFGQRIVWEGDLNGEKVAVKMSTTELDFDQQKQEEALWKRAVEEGDQGSFAKVYAADDFGRWIVQEYCTHVKWYREDWELEDIPPEIFELRGKYGISELQLGYGQDGDLKFVDYGI